MLKVIAAAPAVTQESLLIGMTSFPLNVDAHFPFSQVFTANLVLKGQRWVKPGTACFIYLCYEYCLAFLFQVASADEVVKTMIDLMTNTNSQSHLPLKTGPSSVPNSDHIKF